MAKTYGLSEAVMRIKQIERHVENLNKAMDLISDGDKVEPGTLADKVDDAYIQSKYTITAITQSTVVPLDTAFIRRWEQGEYGTDTLEDAIKKHYAQYLVDKALLRPTAFKLGMAVEKYALYKFYGSVWQWIDESVPECANVPNDIGWQWQKQ